MKKKLSMILIKKLKENGDKILHFLFKNITKKYLPAGKMGFRAFALNSEKGVKTPSWRIMGIKNDPHYSERIMGIKNDPHYSEQINCSGFSYYASLVQ